MNSSSLRHVLLKLYFPAAFLVGVILVVFDAIMAPVHAQVRTVTVTVFVTVTQQVYITLERTVMITVATGIPTTFASVMTSVVTSILTQTSLVSRLMTETSVASSLVTQTISVPAPIRVGPLSLDLTDWYGLRFLGYTGGVALVGFIGGILVQRTRTDHGWDQITPVLESRRRSAARLDEVFDSTHALARLDESLVESARLAAELKGIGERLKGPLADSAAERSMWKRLHPELDFEFENFDQKANQLLNILGQAVKNLKEMMEKQTRDFL